MPKVFDPDKDQREIKNLGAKIAIFTLIFTLTFYIHGFLSLFIHEDIVDFKKILKLSIEDPIYVSKYLFEYTKYYWVLFYKNITIISFKDYNFILIKILFSGLIPLIGLIALFYKFGNQIINIEVDKKKPSLHGDAHWASEKELIKAGLRAKKGLLMGKDKKGFLIAAGFQHTLLFAPTGSGKGVGFIIPNCVFWEESLICHDIKLENFDRSSKWRRDYLKQKVYCWVPADQDGKSHCYNPLDWISKKKGQMVDDVQKIANIILPKQEFWTNEARTLLVGVILWLLADESKPTTFGEVVRTIRSEDFAYAVAVAMDTLGDVMHPIGYMNLAAFAQKADKERSGVVSTLNSGLELWGNPIIDATTAKSDFNFLEFKIKPTTVFVGLTPDNIQRLKPLMCMFYQQATAFMSQHMPTKEEKYGVCFIMDEFPTVGKLEQFLAGIAYFRGYRVRLFLVVQDTQQLKGTYEDTGMNSFLSNSTYRITFAANNVETAKLISDLVGNQTVESTSTSKSKFLDLNPGAGSISISQSQRALLLPQEVIMLPKDEQIILIEASAPVKTKKIEWYKEEFFLYRVNLEDPLKPGKVKIKEPSLMEKIIKQAILILTLGTVKGLTSFPTNNPGVGIELPIQEPILKEANKKGKGGEGGDPSQKRLSED